MFNLLDVTEGEKIDFWLLTDEPFDRARFARRQRDEIDRVPVYVSSPEDTILAKLRWAKMCGGSEKQFTDARQVYEFQHAGFESGIHQRMGRTIEITRALVSASKRSETCLTSRTDQFERLES